MKKTTQLKVKENTICENIRSGYESRTRAVHFLLNHTSIKKNIFHFVLQNKGDQVEAQSVFHDTIVAFVKYVFKHKDFQIETSLQAYLVQTAKNLWINELRKKGRIIETSELKDYDQLIDSNFALDEIILKENKNILSEILNKLAQNCKEVLMHWSAGYNMTEIASILNYKSEGMARKKKSQCMKQLYEFLAENPQIKKQLNSLL